MPKIKINDISIYYEEHGQGEPLVLISGLNSEHVIWTSVLDKFAKHYRVILLNNRGAGQTDAPDGPYTIEQMADDAIDLCKKLQIEKAHFIGSSMGSCIVQAIAYRHPEFLKSIIASNALMVLHASFLFNAQAQVELRKANAPMAAIIKTACAWGFSYHFLAQPGRIEQYVQASMANPYPITAKAAEAQLAALEVFDSRSWASSIKVPMLIISADQDIVIPERLSQDLAREIPHAEYYSFTDCGHIPYVEYPAEYFEVAHKFLQKHN